MVFIFILLLVILLGIAGSYMYSGSAENMVLYISPFHTMDGYDPESKFMERYMEKKGYRLLYLNENDDLIAMIKENKRDLICLAIYISVYRLSGKKYMHKNRLTTAKTIIEYFSNLEDNTLDGRMRVIPPASGRYLFETKLYSKHFEEDYPEFYLPYTRTFVDADKQEVVDCVTELLKEFPEVMLKKGFSSVKRGVISVKKNDDVADKVEQIYSKMRVGKHEYNPAEFEAGCTRIVIVQPYNKIVASRETEYRFHFINNKFSGYICRGSEYRENETIEYPTIIYDPENLHHSTMRKMAEDGFAYAKLRIGGLGLLRVDISYSVDPKCQDSHSLEVDGEMRRYYINEIEMTPSLYLGNPVGGEPVVVRKDEKREMSAETKKFQEDILSSFMDSIVDFMNSNK